MNQDYKNLVAWVRINGDGYVVPGSLEFRKRGVKPSDGRWIQVQSNYCCSSVPSPMVIFRNTTASANITKISFGSTVWTGTLANGQYLALDLPNGYDYTVSITVDTPSGRTLTTSTTQGTGTISAIGGITLATNTATTSVSTDSQYLVILS